MKIPEMKLHPRKLHKIVTPHWNFQGQKTKEISSRFFYHSWKFHFFFHWPMTSGISTFYFFNNPAWKHHALNSPSCGCMHFFLEYSPIFNGFIAQTSHYPSLLYDGQHLLRGDINTQAVTLNQHQYDMKLESETPIPTPLTSSVVKNIPSFWRKTKKVKFFKLSWI